MQPSYELMRDVSQSRFFTGIGAADLELILSEATERQAPAGTVVTHQGAPANELFLEQENFSGGQVPDSQLFTLTDPVGPTVGPAS